MVAQGTQIPLSLGKVVCVTRHSALILTPVDTFLLLKILYVQLNHLGKSLLLMCRTLHCWLMCVGMQRVVTEHEYPIGNNPRHENRLHFQSKNFQLVSPISLFKHHQIQNYATAILSTYVHKLLVGWTDTDASDCIFTHP